MAKNKQKVQQNVILPRSSKSETKVSTLPNPINSDFQLSPIWVYCILILSVLLAFGAGFSNEFLYWDDPMYVTENKMIQSPTLTNLIRLLTVECALNYHPLTLISLWLNSALFGKGATSFIVVNTFIHIINTFLIFRFTQYLTKKNILVSFLVALFWGIHPMHVESVIWISERKDVLYTMFFFLACIQYAKFLEQNERKNLIYCFIFFVLSCLSKGMAVVLPIVLLLIDYWYDRSFLTLKNIVSKLPFFIVALLFGLLAIHIQSGGDLGGKIEKMTLDVALSNLYAFGEKIKFGFFGFLLYFFKFFFPINQHNFYAYPNIDKYNAIQFLLAPVLSILILGGIFLSYNRKKEVFFGGMFFFITVVLVLQFLSVGQAIVAERYTYIPYFGILFSLIYFLNQKIKTAKILLLGSSIMATLFIYLTYRQVITYKNTGTLFLNSYKYEPDSPTVNENIANHFGRIGDMEEVLKYGEFAVSKGVNSSSLYLALANAYSIKGNLTKGLELYQKSIDNSPNHRKILAYNNRAFTYFKAGLFDEASKDYTKIMELENDRVSTYLPLRASANLKGNKFKEAYDDYTKLVTIGLAIDTTYNNRAVARFSLGDRDGAIKDLKEALRINPNYIDVRENLVKLGVKP
jgi:protein O-mannosyl-transferase